MSYSPQKSNKFASERPKPNRNGRRQSYRDSEENSPRVTGQGFYASSSKGNKSQVPNEFQFGGPGSTLNSPGRKQVNTIFKTKVSCNYLIFTVILTVTLIQLLTILKKVNKNLQTSSSSNLNDATNSQKLEKYEDMLNSLRSREADVEALSNGLNDLLM